MNVSGPPKLLAGRYAHIKELARSANSVVCHYVDTANDGEPVAIKFIPAAADEALSREFFLRETTALSRTRHPNIIALKDSGSEEGVGFWLALEYAGGGSLEAAATRVRYQGPAQYARLLLACSRALLHAHCEHVLHRDLKPANILFLSDGTPKIADFNVSKIVGGVRSKETVRHFLSTRYAAPEIIAGKSAIDRSDIFSLGLVFAELMLPPTQDPRVLLQELPTTCPGPLRRVVRHMCAENPSDRMSLPEAIGELTQICREFEDRPRLYVRPTKKVLHNVAAVHGCTLLDALEHVRADFRSEPRTALAVRRNEDGEPVYAVRGQRFRYSAIPLRPPIDGQELRLIGCSLLRAEDREQRKHDSIAVPVDVLVADLSQRLPANEGVDVFEHVHAEMQMEWQAGRVSSRRREAVIEKWESYVDISREAQQAKLLATVVGASRIADDMFDVEVTFDSGADLDAVAGAILLCTSPAGETVSLGTVVDRRGATLTIHPQNALPSDYVVACGSHLTQDAVREGASLARQRRALNSLRQNSAVLPELADLLLDPTIVLEPQSKVFTPATPELHDDNRAVVARALGTRQLFLVQGPPGTGKTTVLTELIAQILKEHPAARLLLSSQSNVAVDNVLDRLAVLVPSIQAVRLGRPEKIDEATRQYELDNLVQAAAKNAVERLAVRRELLLRLQQDGAKERLQILDTSTSGATDSAEWIANVEDGALELTQEAGVPSLEYRTAALRLSNVGGERLAQLQALQDKWEERMAGAGAMEQEIIGSAQVIAGTCIGFAANPAAGGMEYDWVIIDEAGRASPPEVLVPMVRGRRIVLVGDHRQLPPILDDAVVRQVAEKLRLAPADLQRSLFEDLFDSVPEAARMRLVRQYRMHPDIGDLVSHAFYDSELKHGVAENDRVLGGLLYGAPVRWLNTEKSSRRTERKVGTSFVNEYEAERLLQDLARALQRVPDATSVRVGLLTAYAPQADLIRQLISPYRGSLPTNVSIDVLTVDSAQGREFEIVYYSAVRSNPKERIGFLADERRLNVALSRARDALTIVGDKHSITGAGNLHGVNPFRRIITYARKHENRIAFLDVA